MVSTYIITSKHANDPGADRSRDSLLAISAIKGAILSQSQGAAEDSSDGYPQKQLVGYKP